MRTITHRRVVVTGMGGISNLGRTGVATWAAMKEGRSGISPLQSFPQNEDWTVRFAGEIHDFDPSHVADGREQKRIDRVALFAMVAAHEAVLDSGYDIRNEGDPYRHGTIIGSGIGGVLTMEDLAEQSIDELMDIDGMDEERAGKLIMTARAPWFE